MIIDSHSHVCLPVEEQINTLLNAGVEKTILFGTSVHPEKATNFAEYKDELIRLHKIIRGEINPLEARIKATEELHQVVTAFSDRFIGFGFCPTGMTEIETNEWITKNILAKNFYGIGEFTLPPGGINSTENIFKAVSGLCNLPLWFHTFNPMPLTDIKLLIEYARLYPKVNIILGHGGGSHWFEIIEEIARIKNIYFDISASFTTHSLKIASELIPERILFSVDMPYNSPLVMKTYVEECVKDNSVRELIFSENIKQLIDF